MRSSSNSLKTVSFNTPRTTEDLRSSLLEEENNEEPICQYTMTRYVAHIMIGFIIIGSGIWIGILYLVRNA